MIIKNYKEIATTRTRKDALKIINSGIKSVLTKHSIKEQLKIVDDILYINNKRWNLKKFQNIYVIGAGKASIDMAKSIEDIFGKRITKGIVIDTRNKKLKKILVKKGTHPLPSQMNINATKQIVKLLKNTNEDDLVISLISGGGSSLLNDPRITLTQEIKLNKVLLSCGANINEINAIRKHLSYVKGGQLEQLIYPSTSMSLIISDVIGDRLDVIASGPTVMDKATLKQAKKIIKKYGLEKYIPMKKLVETPKHRKLFSKVDNILIVTNNIAVKSMQKKAIELGYKTKILTTTQKGEAKNIGKKYAKICKKGYAYISAGETTVTINGKGKGGRNQEFVLGALKNLKNGVVISCSSDGVDFITQAAGGIVDENTLLNAKNKKLNFEKSLNNNDSYNFLKKVNGIIKTGKTGTNVGDLILVLGNKE